MLFKKSCVNKARFKLTSRRIEYCLHGLCFTVDNTGKCGLFLSFVADKFTKGAVIKDTLIICVKLPSMASIIGALVGRFALS